MISATAKDLEKHLANQMEDLIGRFAPVADLVLTRSELAMILINCGVAMIGNACTNLATSAKPGQQKFVVDAAVEIARLHLDKVPDRAMDLARAAVAANA